MLSKKEVGEAYFKDQISFRRAGSKFVSPPALYGRIKLIVEAVGSATVQVVAVSAGVGNEDFFPRVDLGGQGSGRHVFCFLCARDRSHLRGQNRKRHRKKCH